MILPSIAAIIGGLCFSITESIYKSISEDKYSSFAYAFTQHFLNFLIFLIPSLFIFKLPPFSFSYIYLAIVVIVVFFINTLALKSYKTVDISNISIIGNLSLVINFFIGVIFLTETTNIYKIIGIIFILIGVIIVFYEGKKVTLTQGLIAALLSAILTGLRPLLDKLNLQFFDIFVYTCLGNLGVALLILGIPKARKDIPKIFSKYKTKIFISRIAGALGYFLIYWSIANGSISVVSTNSSITYLLGLTLIGIVILKENKFAYKKLAGSLLCILGIILLNFF